MNKIKCILIGATVAAVASSALAQSSVNEERCRRLEAEIQSAFQKAVSERVPTQSPAKYVEQSIDLKGLLSIDTSAGFSKLISTAFNKLIDSLIQKGFDNIYKKADKTFTDNINNYLRQNGIAPVMQDPNPTPPPPSRPSAPPSSRPKPNTAPSANSPYDRP